METISFKLDAFEGPLDLLLYLITKHKLNICDIEISLLLDQYLEYIESIDEQDFDAAGDFLAMAARLVYIKTCSLLPSAEEAEELKKELEGDLIEYSACKQAAAKLREICVYGAVFVRPPEKLPINKTFTGTLDVQKLVDAYMGMSEKSRAIKPVRAEQFSPIVATRIVTVTSKIVFVLKKLYRSGECAMSELYEGISDKSARVATFLAVLELTKSGRIFLNDDNSIIKFNRESKRKHNHEPAVTSEISEPQTDPLDDVQPELPEPVSEEIAADEPITDPEQIEEHVDETPEIADISDSSPDEPKKITEVFVAPIRECSIPETRRDQHKLAVPVAAIHIESADEPKAEEQTEYKNMNIIRAERKEQEQLPPADVKITRGIKLNRFGEKWRWTYPENTANCWIYGRERM